MGEGQEAIQKGDIKLSSIAKHCTADDQNTNLYQKRS